MKKSLISVFKQHEIQLVTAIIGVVFVVAMAVVAWMLRGAIAVPPHEALSDNDLKQVFATAYIRYREDDGTPYLKVELHNGTLWWIKKVEFEFDGIPYALNDPHTFQPLHFGAVRCLLKKPPPLSEEKQFRIKILKAYGYPPAEMQAKRSLNEGARGSQPKAPED